jgi:hypothetical protein
MIHLSRSNKLLQRFHLSQNLFETNFCIMAISSDRIGYILFFSFIFIGLLLLMVCVTLEFVVMLVTLCRSLIRRSYASPTAGASGPQISQQC